MKVVLAPGRAAGLVLGNARDLAISAYQVVLASVEGLRGGKRPAHSTYIRYLLGSKYIYPRAKPCTGREPGVPKIPPSPHPRLSPFKTVQ